MLRRGYKTTEFWLNIIVGLLDVVTQIPFQDKAIVSAVAAIYAIARGLAKNSPTPDQLVADYIAPPVNSTDRPENR